MKPYDVTSTKQCLKMDSDNHLSGDFALLLNGNYISLHTDDGSHVKIPRENFNKLVDWYIADQPPA